MLTRLSNYMERLGQQRVKTLLLSMPDSYLAEHGFSRELIEQGPTAWPWRTEKTEAAKPTLISENSKVKVLPGGQREALQPLDWVA